ncbi:uncharacterized protein LOC102617577 isoform X4 [Citrus sinensis]|uniref:uncharacterized protein LOC102617577 isoform X4 n=1 Tax=Citrus sinensis TaxID=2711 RepID=UPI002278B606|nr:uncharacterized protein LOC102617577 isoform X4 [Citrus sinensis]
MKAIQFLIGFALLALASSLASASDPSPLQDICVAINDPKDGGNVHVSKYICLLLRDYGSDESSWKRANELLVEVASHELKFTLKEKLIKLNASGLHVYIATCYYINTWLINLILLKVVRFVCN